MFALPMSLARWRLSATKSNVETGRDTLATAKQNRRLRLTADRPAIAADRKKPLLCADSVR